MTVTYTGQVANARLYAFSRLLLYWRGSIYKLVYKEMIIFMVLYTMCSCVYRFALLEYQKRVFEHIVLYCHTFTQLIPLSFVLGFYVAIVVTRWWSQFMCIPWPDKVMLYVSTVVEGVDERSRMIRRTLMRYLTLASLMVFQATSVSVKKRFPTEDHLIEAGMMTLADKKTLDNLNTPHGKWWVPFSWCFNIIKTARQEGRIKDDFLLKTIWEEILQYRTNLGTLYSYDWISIPLVYTQVCTLAVYTFFLGCVLGRQFLDPKQGYPGHDVDMYVPVFTILQFFFYMGWLKVAEQMINPFGEDDDDFDMNWIIDRNLQVSLLTVDNMYGQYPSMERDMYWDEYPPECLPYTKSAIGSITKPFEGSCANVNVSDDGMQIVTPMETIAEDNAVQYDGIENPQYESNTQHLVIEPPAPGTSRTPRPGHRLLTDLYTQLSQSRLTLGQLSQSRMTLGSQYNLEKAVPPATTAPNNHNISYLESWLNDPNTRASSKLDLAHRPQSFDAHQFRDRSGSESSQSNYTLAGRREFIPVESPLVADRSVSPSMLSIAEQPPAYTQSPCMTPTPQTEVTEPIPSVGKDTVVTVVADSNLTDGVVTPLVKTVTITGSNDSIHEYASSDSTNSTVNSLAPLLKDYQDTVIDM